MPSFKVGLVPQNGCNLIPSLRVLGTELAIKVPIAQTRE